MVKLEDVAAKYLKRLNLPASVNTFKLEGADGDLQWKSNSKKTLSLLWRFRQDVIENKSGEVKNILETLLAEEQKPASTYITKSIMKKDPECLKEAFMVSICVGSRPVAEFVVSLFWQWPWEERSACTSSPAFPPHITPLMLACLVNNFAIVEMLLLRGHTILQTHHRGCLCNSCERQAGMQLNAASRIDIFRSLCSDAFLWLGTDDPYVSACKMSSDLEVFVNENTQDDIHWYEFLQTSVQQFNAKIIDQQWTLREIDIVLSNKEFVPYTCCDDPYPRLQMAIDAEMRELVANSNIQKAVNEIWMMEWAHLEDNPIQLMCLQILHILFYPIISLIYIFSNGRYAITMRIPYCRFICNVSSYILFVILMMVLIEFKTSSEGKSSKRKMVVEIYLFIYAIGVLIDKQFLVARYGIRNFFQFWWRAVDMLMTTMFLGSAQVWLLMKITNRGDNRHHTAHRRHWFEHDPYIVYEIFMCITFFISCLRTFFYLQSYKSLGTTIISIGKSIVSVTNFFLLIGCVVIAFAVATDIVSSPYDGGATDDGSAMGDEFTSYGRSVVNLFWSLFNYLDVDNYKIVVGNAGEDFEVVNQSVSNNTIYILSAVFHMSATLSIMNLLISVMVQKAFAILENEEKEYKYNRMAQVVEFTHWTSSVPPPFNIIHIIVQYIIRATSDDFVFQWPELFIEKEIVNPSPDYLHAIYHAYKSSLIKTYRRFVASHQHRYNLVYHTDYDKETIQKRQYSHPKVAFMNDYEARARKEKANEKFIRERMAKQKKD